MQALNRGVDARQRAAVSLRIVARVEAPGFCRARTVGLCALPDEPDLSDALVRWSGRNGWWFRGLRARRCACSTTIRKPS